MKQNHLCYYQSRQYSDSDLRGWSRVLLDAILFQFPRGSTVRYFQATAVNECWSLSLH